jgi:hypothetical protein
MSEDFALRQGRSYEESWGQQAEHQRGQELANLRFNWGSAYSITDHQGQWMASRVDTHEVLTACTADELRDKIHADHRARPVPIDRRDGPTR